MDVLKYFDVEVSKSFWNITINQNCYIIFQYNTVIKYYVPFKYLVILQLKYLYTVEIWYKSYIKVIELCQ